MTELGDAQYATQARGERVLLVLPPDAPPPTREADPMDLSQLWAALWGGKWLALGVAAAVTLLAVAYALRATEWFHAEVLLAPATRGTGQGLASQVGQLGGLAALAGIGLNTTSNSDEPIAVLKSQEFARAFIEEQNLLPVLFAEKWDTANGRWKSADPKRQPDIRDAVKYFDDHVRQVRDDKKTGLVTVTVEWKNAVQAAEWANLLAERLNDRLRERALADASGNVKFLQQEIADTNLVALQQAIGRLLESELEKLMIARGNTEFAFRVVDHAVPSKWQVRPNRGQIVMLGAVGGLVLGAFTVLVRYAVRTRRRLPPTPARPAPGH